MCSSGFEIRILFVFLCVQVNVGSKVVLVFLPFLLTRVNLAVRVLLRRLGCVLPLPGRRVTWPFPSLPCRASGGDRHRGAAG